MKYTKEEILKGAFAEFMAKGYDSTTISDLQKKLDMSRGAVYRHFRNKDDLFISVMDKYVFSYLERLTYDFKEDITIPLLIDLTYERQKKIIAYSVEAGITYHLFLNFTALLIQAAKYYPGFEKKFAGYRASMEFNWRKAFINSQQRKEIKPEIDVNIMTRLFSNISINDNRGSHKEGASFADIMKKDAEQKKITLTYLYNMMKV